MNYPSHPAASILCVGLGWFPTTPGGLNRYLYELTQHLAIAGDRIEFCGVDIPEQSPYSGLVMTNLTSPDRPLPQRLWSVRQQFTKRQFSNLDAINLHFALYSFPVLSQLPDHVPVTFNFQGPWALESQWEGASKWNVWFKQWIEQQVYQRCDRFIVLSQAFGKILHESYQVPWEQIYTIPGGVNTTQFQANLSRTDARTQLDWPLDRPILFTSRRLVHRMGLEPLLTAIAQVKQYVPDVWLAIAGKGPLKASLEQQIQALSLENHVKLLGYLPDDHLPIAYQAADLTVVPSQSLEGFGLILVESMASGTPALCTPVGGMPEVIAPFYPELVTESTDASAIADRLTQFLKGQISLPGRNACRDYAVSHFDWKTISQTVRSVLLA